MREPGIEGSFAIDKVVLVLKSISEPKPPTAQRHAFHSLRLRQMRDLLTNQLLMKTNGCINVVRSVVIWMLCNTTVSLAYEKKGKGKKGDRVLSC